MIKCSVESHHSAYIVTIEENGKTVLLQTDSDQVAFAVSCGLITAPDGWDGSPDLLGKAWEDCNLEDITECPNSYYYVTRG